MKTLLKILSMSFLFVSCATTDADKTAENQATPKKNQVTIETSGDLQFAKDSGIIQIDFFGSCALGAQVVSIKAGEKKAKNVACKNNRYSYTYTVPKKIFKEKGAYALETIEAFNPGQEDYNATSFVLIDRQKKEVRSVLNKQVRFERIPTGQFVPVTEFSAFGSCSDGSSVTIDLTALDRFGHRISKYDDSKACQSSGFYFLSQVDGLVKKGMRFHVYETKTSLEARGPAAATKDASKPHLKNVFEWTVRLQ